MKQGTEQLLVAHDNSPHTLRPRGQKRGPVVVFPGAAGTLQESDHTLTVVSLQHTSHHPLTLQDTKISSKFDGQRPEKKDQSIQKAVVARAQNAHTAETERNTQKAK